MINTFESYHPIIIFGYFSTVILLSVMLMHPLFLGISLMAAFCYAVFQTKYKTFQYFGYSLPIIMLITLINPLFNHRGATILFYFLDNPITLESTIYGICTALMLVSVLLWFISYNVVMSSDKFLYLFGKLSPAMALILSMTLSLVPKLKHQIKVISNAQKTMGQDNSSGAVTVRAKHGLKIVSVLTSWALENSIETSDSMKARGYGLPNRTAFSIFRFHKRDAVVGCFMLGCLTFLGWVSFEGFTYFEFYPTFGWTALSPQFCAALICYGILCFLPIILELMELLRWKCFA